jgi:hypothetical protein
MNKLLSINKVGLQGLNSDMAPWDLPAEFITFGRNFRVTDDKIVVNNKVRLFGAVPMNIQMSRGMVAGTSRFSMFIAGGATGVIAYNPSTTGRLLTTLRTNAPHYWTFARLGAMVFANHPEVGTFYWWPVDPNVQLERLPFKPVPDTDPGPPGEYTWYTNGHYGQVLRSHKNYLFMLDLTEPNDQDVQESFPDAVRWSHPAEMNKAPVTWDETDRFFLAGKMQMGANTGRVIDGLSMRDSFIIYSEEGINSLTLSGDVFVWNRQQITAAAGLLAKDCVVELQGNHFFISNEDICMFDGNQVTSIAHNRIRRALSANIRAGDTNGINDDAFKRSFAVRNDDYKEIWFCIPSGDAPYPSTAYIYNWRDGTWAIRDLPGNTRHIFYGSRARPEPTYRDLASRNPPPTYANYKGSYGSVTRNPYDNTLIALQGDAGFYDYEARASDVVVEIGLTYKILSQYEPPPTYMTPPFDTMTYDDAYTQSIPNVRSYNSAAFRTKIERIGFPLAAQEGNGHRGVTTMVNLYPHFGNSVGKVRIRVGSQDFAGAGVRWNTWQEFDPVTQRKLSVRTTGKLHCWRIESLDEGYFEFSGMDIEYAESGLR